MTQPEAKEELAVPVVSGSVEIGERGTLLSVEVSVDGAEDDTIVRAVARWDDDDEVIFDSEFGETEGPLWGGSPHHSPSNGRDR